MTDHLSVIIPTRNRPSLLAEAIESVLSQTRLPDAIIVGDDSDDPGLNAAVVTRLMAAHDYPAIRHLTERAGNQAANVERLFAATDCRWICLLHDDDLLLPDAIAMLLEAAEAHRARTGNLPVLIYGQQIVVNNDGTENSGATEGLNAFYHRGTAQRSDLVSDPLLASILQQAPNDGYLVDRAAAMEVGYDRDPTVGQACDFAFPFRLSKVGEFCYVPRKVAKYRLTEHSVLRGAGTSQDDTALRTYLLLKRQLPASIQAKPLVRNVFRDKVRLAIEQARRNGSIGTAWRMLLSRDHFANIATFGFWVRGLRLLRTSLMRLFGR